MYSASVSPCILLSDRNSQLPPGWQKPHSSPVKKHPNLWDMKTFFFFVVHGLSLAKQPPSGT
jgi:hypothetical protein